MSKKRGPGSSDDHSDTSLLNSGDEWGTETIVGDPADPETAAEEALSVEWDDELSTSSAYFSDEQLASVELATKAAQRGRPLPEAQLIATPATPEVSNLADGPGFEDFAIPPAAPLPAVEKAPLPPQDEEWPGATPFEDVFTPTAEPVAARRASNHPLPGPAEERHVRVAAAAEAVQTAVQAPERARRSMPPPPFATPSMMPPPKAYDSGATALGSYQSFRTEMHRLARTRDYRSIAALHESALLTAPWASQDDNQLTMLVDLARLYRDRLGDRAKAQTTFERLAKLRPGHEEAMTFLTEAYDAQGNMRALHDLYASAVDEEWGPERRVELTRYAARIALEHLNDPSAAARDWERLLELGDMDGQVTVELSRVYREAERWTDLGEFLENRAQACAGTTRVAILREAVEAFLAGARDHHRAEALIEQILAVNADDPVALASLANVKARQGSWSEVEAIATRPMADVPGPARLDVLRLVASLLVSAGEHDRAALAYERVLQTAANDPDAVAAREDYLERKADHEGLVTFLISRADKARTSDEKAARLQRAAEVADRKLDNPEKSAELWRRAVQAKPDNVAAYDSLVALYDRLNDVAGITRALEGLAAVTREPKARAAVLRRLGEHYAYRADNDEQAQRCWLEVASILPDDLDVQRELNGIHRRRGDFAALDVALGRQLWRTTDQAQAVDVAREISRNLDDNLNEGDRTARAWLHVLDLAPDDVQTLEVLSEKLADRSNTTEVHGILEARLARAQHADEPSHKSALALQIASDWDQRANRPAAVASYERARCWAANSEPVLDGLLRLYGTEDATAAVSVLELACARADEPEAARALLRRALPLIPEDRHRNRFFLLRRLLRFDPSRGLDEVVAAATSAGAWRDLAALYETLAETAVDADQRRAFQLKLAEICEKQLGDGNRAYVSIQALGLSALRSDDAAAVESLAETTGRWEDLLAVLNASILNEASPATRQAVFRKRAEICEQRLNDPHRAFLELQRLVQEGPLERPQLEALEQMHRLAPQHGLLQELEALYGELWDRATDDDARVSIARARMAIRRDHLNDPAGALQQALVVLRLRPADEQAAADVLTAAETLGMWGRALPVVEGVWRATQPDTSKLVHLAKLHREKCADAARAIELVGEALRIAPDNDDALSMLEQLGEQANGWPRVVQAIRLAAGATAGTDRGLELARRVAALYADKLQDTSASLEVHRWILQVWPQEMASLDIIIDAHRAAGEHDELRARLEQWIERSHDSSRQVERWLEIGRLCRDHLDDSGGALVAYSSVIELDSSNDEASDAMRALADVSLPATLRRKQIRVELRRASGGRRVDLLKQLAELEQELGEQDAAIAALRELFSLEDGRDAAFGTLSKLLRSGEHWQELAALHEDYASGVVPSDDKLDHLRSALRITEDRLRDPQRQERLLRAILALAPSDGDASIRIARLLRDADRLPELADELAARLNVAEEALQPFERTWMTHELVRVLALGLGRSKDADKVLRGGKDLPEADAALWLAASAARADDHAHYLEYRRRHIKKLPARLAALVVCHLAEHCDQFMKLKGRVLALYREARQLDADNSLAGDALRGLGRGVKTWRTTAALLPVPNEAALSNKDRSTRLRRMGDASKANDAVEALNWYERAVAVDPDNVEAWDAIAAIATERRDLDYAYLAAVEGILAFERTIAPAAAQVAPLARRLAQAAKLASTAHKSEEGEQLSATAFCLDPNVPAAAILAADARYEAGAHDVAVSLYTRILDQLGDSLTTDQRAHVLHRRATTALKASDLTAAHADLKAALAASPLFPTALDAMAEVLRKQGHPVNATLHELRALLVTRAPERRGQICRRIGELCDTDLSCSDEAGAWFELAVEAGVEDKALMRRLLEHFRRTDRAQQALVAIGDLIETTTDPMELADLWAMRGSILADHDLPSAEEALDIALSFNPSHRAALSALRAVLEQQGDHEQLVALLDARAEAATPEDRADALHSLVRICLENLQDPERAEQYLQRLVELSPTREAIEQLLRVVENDPSRHDERLPLLGRLLGFGPPFCDRVVEIARILSERGHRHWTWALLSSLMGAAPVDPWTKATLAELRREFERFDSLTLLRPDQVELLAQLPEPEPFQAALSDLCARLFLVSDDGASAAVDGRTGPGKIFERVVEGLGLEAKLVRSQSTQAVSVLAGETLTIAMRTDLMSAPPGELAFMYVLGLMLARKECIALASVPEDDRLRLVPAVAMAVLGDAGPAQGDEATAALAARIAEALSGAELEAWRQQVADLEGLAHRVNGLFWQMDAASLRLALVAAGDLRTASRGLARLAPDNKRPPGVAKLDDFETFFASIPQLAPLFAFAASEDFGAVFDAPAKPSA